MEKKSMEQKPVEKVPFAVSYRNVNRINAEIAHYNPDNIPGADMLDYILDRYFAVAKQFRKYTNRPTQKTNFKEEQI